MDEEAGRREGDRSATEEQRLLLAGPCSLGGVLEGLPGKLCSWHCWRGCKGRLGGSLEEASIIASKGQRSP